MGLLRRRGAAADPEDGRNGRWFAVVFFVAVLLLLGGLYAAGYAFTTDRVPQQVSVAGVDIGGMTPDQARARLERELAPRADEPIVAHAGDRTYRIDPREAGLRLDLPATVQAAGAGRSLNPLHMVEVLTGGQEVEPVVEVDETALDVTVQRLAHRVRQRPVEGAIRFVQGRAKPVYPTPGRVLEEGETQRLLHETFLTPEPSFDLPVRKVETSLSDEDVDTAMRRFAEPAMSAAVTVRASGRTARLTPTRIGKALSMVPRDGRLVPEIDEKLLTKRAAEPLDALTTDPRPATVVLSGGSPQVVGGENGTELDLDPLARKVLRALTERGDDRAIRLHAHTVEPKFGIDEARGLGVEEVVSSFTTQFPHSSYRNQNLGRAAELINGTLLRPGEIFSLNDVVGERTAANGFTKGYIIDNGVLVEDFGGGVSQVATTTYNAAFFAGLKDIEHHPHSLYFTRYPMGREATVAWGALDLRFQNTTPYGVLVQAWIEPSSASSDGEMHVRMWSTKHWDIDAGLSEPYDYTKPGVRYSTAKNCLEQTGYRGFDVDVYRYFNRGGERVRTEKWHVTYDAADTVHCRPPPQRSES